MQVNQDDLSLFLSVEGGVVISWCLDGRSYNTTGTFISPAFRPEHIRTMKVSLSLLATLLILGVASAFPQQGPQGEKEGAFFTNEAIRQAQNTYLIPKDATIQKVQEGIQLAAYESIPGNQRINLFEILGEHVPPEVVNNLQGQIDQVGKQ